MLAAAVMVVAVAFPSFTPTQAATGVPFTNSAVDKVHSSGSGITLSLMNDLAAAYMESDGCLLASADLPLTAASPTQNRCQSGTGAALAGDNIYENYDHDVIVNYSLSPVAPEWLNDMSLSDVGIGQLCNQKSSANGGPDRDPRVPFVDFARVQMQPPYSEFYCGTWSGGEAGTSLRFIAFARSALSFTHWNTDWTGGAHVNNLTQAQLRDIFITCAITDWGAVGGSSGDPIVVYTASITSEARLVWESFLGGGNSSTCIPPAFKDGSFANGERVIPHDQMWRVEAAPNDPGAADEGNSIYYMSTGLHDVNPALAAHSLLGDINGFAPSESNIVSGVFPFSWRLYNVIRQSGNSPVASSATRRFVSMRTSSATNGQEIGWICKGEAYHSEPIGNPSPVGIEVATATQDWFEIKKAAFAANGVYQLPPDAFGNRCTFFDVAVT